jgi:sulfopyruvate decarboxylase TPP-binding subunit
MSNNVPAIDPQTFWDALKARRLTFFSGVPDSTFQRTYNAMVADPDIRYIPAVREDVALGVASAAFFSRRSGRSNDAELRHRKHS